MAPKFSIVKIEKPTEPHERIDIIVGENEPTLVDWGDDLTLDDFDDKEIINLILGDK